MANRPGVIDRARLALKVFRGGMPPPRVKAAPPFTWPAFKQGQPQWHLQDFESYVQEGFYRNPLIYRAVMYKVYAKWLAPLQAYKGDPQQPDRVPESHPLAQLIARPNPYQSMMEFEALSVAYANVAGNCYIWMQRPRSGGLPDAMYTLRPDRVFVVPDPRYDRRRILGYWYVPEGRTRADGVPLSYEDLMHVKFPNPGDTLEGMGEGFSPVGPGARSADVDNQITHFLKDFFERGLMPNVVLSFDDILDQADVDEIRTLWSEIYGGTEGWLKPGVLGRGGEVNRLSYSFDEMGFEVLDERNETRITGPFGVPAVLIGARVGLQNATYSNVEGLRRVFWEDVFVPELQLFEQDYRYYLRSDDGAWVGYDLSGVPALQEDTPALIQAARTMWEMGVPANLAFRTVGVDVEPVPGGDTGYVSSAMLPSGTLGAEMIAPATQPDQATVDEGDSPQVDEEDREDAKFWERRALEAQQVLPALLPALEPERTQRDRALMLAVLTGEKRRTVEERRSVDWEKVGDIWVQQVGTLTSGERILYTVARNEGWSVERMAKALQKLTSDGHVAEYVDFRCPLCQHVGADRYMDHGGLCVCQGCGKTYDPQVEFVG